MSSLKNKAAVVRRRHREFARENSTSWSPARAAVLNTTSIPVEGKETPHRPPPDDEPPLSELGQEACTLATDHGWRVHPCDGKRPILKCWPDRATTNLDLVEAAWRENPDAAVGIATGAESGIAVLDVDDRAKLDQWLTETGVDLPETVVAITPRGGEHRYFKHPGAGSVIGNTTGHPPGCDIRGEGGNIIAPVGEGRGWVPGLSPRDVDLAPFPFELIKNVTGKTTTMPNQVPEGNRNSTLTSLAGSMRRRGASEAAIRAALLEENQTRCKPPLSEAEVARIAGSVAKYPPTMDHHLTDAGNGRRFVEHHRDAVLYCGPWGCWFLWDGVRWAEDRRGGAVELAKATALTIYEEAANETNPSRRKRLAKWAVASENRGRIAAMLYLAQSEPGNPVLPEDLDRDPWLMAVANGTIELHTGKLRPSERGDLITKAAPVAYSETATAPTWEKVLERVLPDPDVRWYVQKAAGYSMTGDVSEQVLFFLHGTGANGKSTALNALLHTLGCYGRQASPDLLMFKYGNEHPTALADLRGRRLVTTSEVQEGRRMAEVMVKQLTGGDLITARRMREDFSSFEPTHKIWLAANHKPIIRGTDFAIWRRIRLIPFTVQIPEADQNPMLPKVLEAESAGILRWMVAGCLAWQREGLEPPAPVRVAVDEYRCEMDQVGQFIAERCNLDRKALTRASVLRKVYEAWCEANGERPMSATALGLRLQEKGLRRMHGRRGTTYEGIDVREVAPDD